MNASERPRHFEYSSLVMGSKDIPCVTYSTKKVSHLSVKTFAKKNEILGAKYMKGKSSKIRTRNERPDIFLEGEKLAKINPIWNQEMDARYL